MCLYPKLIKNRKYQKTKKNKGVIPPLPLRYWKGKMIPDERVLWVSVGCQRCMECRRRISNDWKIRLWEEVRENYKGVFVTLTFSNEKYAEIDKKIDERITGYDRENAIATKATREFLERWRYKNGGKSVKHWLVTELGHQGTENIHIHGVLWTQRSEKFISEMWQNGFIWTNRRKGTINRRIITYITKYITKLDHKHTLYKSKILCSPGIGKPFTKRQNFHQYNRYNGKDTKEDYKTDSGHRMGMPIYYRNKRYTEEQREKLWINKIEAQKIFVDGIECDISKGTEIYEARLKVAREKSKFLGFGDREINWNERLYQRELRNINRLERLKKAEREEWQNYCPF